MTALPSEELPLGFRFHPTEEELIRHYLEKKINGQIRHKIDIIADVEIYKHEPWELPDKSLISSDDLEWFFFSQVDRKYENGHRSNRSTKTGYWKATGRDRIIKSKSTPMPSVIGMKKTLVFHQGKAPKGRNSNWIMHEYRCTQTDGSPKQGDYVLCRLFKRKDKKKAICDGDETDQNSCFPVSTNSFSQPLHSQSRMIKLEEKMTVLSSKVLPVGFRFHPTDVELVNHYLKRKLRGHIGEIEVIPDLDVYKSEPWDLPYKSQIGPDASEWFFFSSRDRKYRNGNRSNRSTLAGYWKVSGRDRLIRSKDSTSPIVIAVKKSLIFYHGRAPHGLHTHWVMHEYCATEPEFGNCEELGLVLYRLFRKTNQSKQSPNSDENEMEISGPSSSPTKSSQDDTEHDEDVKQENDVPMNQVVPISVLQQEEQSVSNIVRSHENNADLSALKGKNEGLVVGRDKDHDNRVESSLLCRSLSRIFTSTGRKRKLPSQVIDMVNPGVSALPVLSASDTNDNSIVPASHISHPITIDLSLGSTQSSFHRYERKESHHSSSPLVGHIQENCSVPIHYASIHTTKLKTLFSKSLAELTLEELKEVVESAKFVLCSPYLPDNLEPIINFAYALRVHLDHQNHIIKVNQEPISKLQRLEAEVPQLTSLMKSTKLEIDEIVASRMLCRMPLQFEQVDSHLAELREEHARYSSMVESKQSEIKKLREEKSRCELIIGFARNSIEQMEADFAALVKPFRDRTFCAN